MNTDPNLPKLNVDPETANLVVDVLDSLSDYFVDPRTWFNTALDIVRGVGPTRAAAAAQQLIASENDLPFIGHLLDVLWENRANIEPAAIAIVARVMWNDDGTCAATEGEQTQFANILRWTRQQAESFLMKPEEIKGLAALPATVQIYRGQFPNQHPKSAGITGLSWTLSRQIADHYTCTPEWPNGWLLTATASRKDILMYVLEWEESEVVIEPAHVRLLSAERGTATEYPPRLERPSRVAGRDGC